MDLAYWGFEYWPFERTSSASRFFAGSLHEEALARLLYLIEEHRRLGLVAGPSGTGKTYLLKILQQRAERVGRLTVRCDATGVEGHELASQIAQGCHVACEPDASSAKIWHGLNLRLMSLAVIQQPLVVMIDHFEDVGSSCVPVIRRLIQLADATGVKLTLLIATRDRQIPASLNDLLDLRIELGSWTIDESSQFLLSATIRAGTRQRLFTDLAVRTMHELTLGVPARIVSLAHLALLAARECDSAEVTREIVLAVSAEFSSRSLNSSSSLPADSVQQTLVS